MPKLEEIEEFRVYKDTYGFIEIQYRLKLDWDHNDNWYDVSETLSLEVATHAVAALNLLISNNLQEN